MRKVYSQKNTSRQGMLKKRNNREIQEKKYPT